MNVATVCIALTLVCAFGPIAAHAESTSVSIASGPAAVSSTAAVSIAGLGAASIAQLPGYPVKAYRDGYRSGRVKLNYVVNADGTVGNVNVLEAFPVQVFTRTASKAVAGWRFAPTGASEQRTVEIQFSAE